MLAPAALTALLLATAAPATPAAPGPGGSAPPMTRSEAETPGPSAPAGRTLWLVQPLYPGQDLLVARTEDALAKMLPEQDRASELVGREELAKAAKDTAPALACVFGAEKCPDPVGALLASWRIERVVLIKAGQDEKGYRFRVSSFVPGSFEPATAESASATLDKALLGALLKVVPLASQLEITTEPVGAAVFVENERVGVTPLSTQILPGEKKIRIELGFHATEELVQVVPVRGRLRIDRKLTELPGKLKVVSPGATIKVDGKEAGRDEIEIGVTSGAHEVELVREGYHPWKTEVSLEPGQAAEVNRTLEPTAFEGMRQSMREAERDIYGRTSWFLLSYDMIAFAGESAEGRTLSSTSEKPSAFADAPSAWGVTFEHGTYFVPWFGLLTMGGTYFQSQDDAVLGLSEFGSGAATAKTSLRGGTLRAAQPTLRYAIWRVALEAQGGFMGRLTHLTTDDPRFDRGFLLLDFGAEVQGALRIHPVAGLFVEGAYRHSFTITGATDGTDEIRMGLGYAY